MTDKKQRGRNICITCYNQHGCLTEDPLCLLMKREEAERSLSGKILMGKRGLLMDCQSCSHFRLCWTKDAYKRATNNVRKTKCN
ncbi:MAG: hypothetical protein AABY49_12355 [Planctomycetota bacterium]